MRKSFIPERLRFARQLLGLSLEAVGERVGTTRQFLHQLETGAKEPTGEMKLALASCLEVDTEFFYLPLKGQVQAEHCHFRRLKTVPQSLMAQASVRATAIGFIVDALENHVGMPEVTIPEVHSNFENPALIENAAETARNFWGLTLDSPIRNVVRVLEHAGAVVVRFDDLSSRIDALSVTRRRPIVVRSTAKGDGPRPRFDLAHELGHLVMHEGIQTGDTETESQAHRFASAFLIPRKAFLLEFPRPIGRRLDWHGLYKMKLRWGMSMRAIIRRAYDLRLIDAAQYRTGNIHLSKTGQTKFENGDDLIPAEHPELLSSAVKYLEENDFYKLLKLIDHLGMTTALFERLVGQEISGNTTNVYFMPANEATRKP